jgi:hypothetical protein
MAKFGLFKMGLQHPTSEYEGDTMRMEKEFVQIVRYGSGDFPTSEVVAVIRLEKGYDVRKISD